MFDDKFLTKSGRNVNNEGEYPFYFLLCTLFIIFAHYITF